MVRPQFQYLPIQCWEHSGPRLGKNSPFICLQGDRRAAEVLLAAVDELATEINLPAQRTLTLLPCPRRKSCETIRLVLSPVSDELMEMSLSRCDSLALFEFTPEGLKLFREKVVAWSKGAEDFSVHPHGSRYKLRAKDKASGEVWFWTPQMDP